MRRIALLAAILILAGCTSDAEIARQQAAADNAKCISDGAKVGDPAYTQCRAQLNTARKQVAATEAARAATPGPIQNRALFHPGQF